MPIDSALSVAIPRRIRLRVRIPFLQAAAVALTGDREAEDDVVDRRHTALIRKLRARQDQRDRWLTELRAALPTDKHAILLALEDEWADEAIAREEAAYMIGVVAEQAVGCRACRDRARRTARAYRAWFRWCSTASAGRRVVTATGPGLRSAAR